MNNKTLLKKLVRQIVLFLLEILKTAVTALPHLIARLVKSVNKRLRFSITFKMTAFYTFIFTVILLVMSMIYFLVFRLFLVNTSENQVKRDAREIAGYINENISFPEDRIKQYAENEGLWVTIFDKNRTLLFTTEKDTSNQTFVTHTDSPEVYFSGNSELIRLNKKVTLKQDTLYIQLRRQLIQNDVYLAGVFAVIFIINIIAIIITMVVGSRTSKKMLRPVENMTRTAKAITAQALDRRLDVVDSHDELKDLAETFNDMLDRIQRSYEQQNQFVSDASHELRTPISVIQGYANLLNRWGKDDKQILEEAIEAIKSEAENMKELVEKLLFLARTDKNTQNIIKEEFLVNELIDEVVRETKLIDADHMIINDRNDAAAIVADRKLIKQVLRIFIDNSIKYTPEGGIIKINSYIRNQRLRLDIEDTGIGISKEDLPFIFDRFYRCDKSRTKETGGTGLGLSIAKWIIGRHNGTIDVESAPGAGTKIFLTLPLG